MKKWLKKLKQLPRRKRDIIGISTALGVELGLILLGFEETTVLVLSFPAFAFFMWLSRSCGAGNKERGRESVLFLYYDQIPTPV